MNITSSSFKGICPHMQLKDMYMRDVENLTWDALLQVGYTPSENIKLAFDKTWVNSRREDYLYEFVFNVYKEDLSL